MCSCSVSGIPSFRLVNGLLLCIFFFFFFFGPLVPFFLQRAGPGFTTLRLFTTPPPPPSFISLEKLIRFVRRYFILPPFFFFLEIPSPTFALVAVVTTCHVFFLRCLYPLYILTHVPRGIFPIFPTPFLLLDPSPCRPPKSYTSPQTRQSSRFLHLKTQTEKYSTPQFPDITFFSVLVSHLFPNRSFSFFSYTACVVGFMISFLLCNQSPSPPGNFPVS